MAKLYLRKCAYIFDWSNSTYFYGTREQHKHKIAVNNALKVFYEDETARNTALDCEQDENGNYYIEVCGERHRLNDIQIASTDNKNDAINHRKFIDAEEVATKSKYFHLFCKNHLYSNKFKSLNFEFFTGENDLGYIRVHFNRNCTRFTIDSRDNSFMTSGENGKLQPITIDKIIDYLDIKSSQAKKEFLEIINIITKEI